MSSERKLIYTCYHTLPPISSGCAFQVRWHGRTIAFQLLVLSLSRSYFQNYPGEFQYFQVMGRVFWPLSDLLVEYWFHGKHQWFYQLGIDFEQYHFKHNQIKFKIEKYWCQLALNDETTCKYIKKLALKKL